MVLSPHIEENRLHIRSAGDRLDVGLDLPLGSCLVTDDGNLPGLSLEKFSKNMTARSDGCG